MASTVFTFALYLTTWLATSVVTSKRITCPPYPYVDFEHGTIKRLGPQEYSFTCDKDYMIMSPAPQNGAYFLSCKDGNWTSLKEPRCARTGRQCDEPPAVEHAKVIGDERHVDSVVMYFCDEGYTLLGNSMLTCGTNQHWDRRAPSCMDNNEPLETLAERLQDSFVTELEYHSADTELGKGRLLDRGSVALGLEMFLLIDRSSSVDPVHLEVAKNFVKFLLEKFKVRNGKGNINGTRAAVIAFGTEVQTVFEIDDITITDFRAAAVAVDKIEPDGGGTNMEDALTKVMGDSQMKLRAKAKRALFLMTDGEPNIGSPGISTQDIARNLRNLEFEIFTVGVGKGVNTRLMTELASEPPLSHVFILDDYPELNDIMKIIQDSPPPPRPIRPNQCGYNATNEDRPWMATLYIGGGPLKLCGGVLICSQWVLTTASCLQYENVNVDAKDVFVVLRERDLMKPDVNQTNFYVTDIRMHQHYDPEHPFQNNLALVKLNEAASFRPACLPPTDRVQLLHQNLKINASLAGWGTTSASPETYAKADDLTFKLLSTSVSLSAEHECPTQTHGITLLCAGQGSKSCYGLVGSPLMAEDSSTGFQHVLGLLVDRRTCSRGQNQYIELTKYIGWINHMTSNCQLKHWGLEP